MQDALHRSELEFLMLGTKLGEGVSRTVYVLKDPYQWGRDRVHESPLNLEVRSPYVVKVERATGRFQNVQEWSVWEWARGVPSLKKWLAPCISISPCGLYLIQQRVEPIRTKELPKRLPKFLIDTHRDNLGILNGRVVCCDYGCGVAAIRSASRRLTNVSFQ